jgi:AhpD family alkylhydroperoxidase
LHRFDAPAAGVRVDGAFRFAQRHPTEADWRLSLMAGRNEDRAMALRLDYPSVAAEGMKALGGVYAYVGRSGLPKALIDLVYLRVSQINGCAYCIDMHSRDLLGDGMTIEKLVLVPAWEEAGNLFSPQERAALRWAETVTRVAETAVPAAEFERAAEQFKDKQLADLTIAISLMNAYNRLAISFRRVPEAAKQG